LPYLRPMLQGHHRVTGVWGVCVSICYMTGQLWGVWGCTNSIVLGLHHFRYGGLVPICCYGLMHLLNRDIAKVFRNQGSIFPWTVLGFPLQGNSVLLNMELMLLTRYWETTEYE
jgi:hypothetical protein